jgi:TonB family protein
VADAGSLGKPSPAPGGGTGRQGEGEHRPQRSLRDALDQLAGGGGLSGGAPLRFDNPVGGLTGPSGGLSFDTKGFDWGPYARKIYWIIWTNWTQGWPPAARAGLPGVSPGRFRIHRDGTITGIVVMDSSGTEAFDTCATLALEASSPLPPLPAEFPKDSEGITARFLYNVSDP